MDSSGLIVAGIFGLAINLLIVYFIIQSATKTQDKIKYMKMQVKLLIKIAQANGVSDTVIDDIITPKKK
jgi:hypothetical protein